MLHDLLLLNSSALLLAIVIMTAVWWHQTKTKNAGIVDGWWSLNFGMIAVLYALLGTGNAERKLFLALLVVVWSLRLGIHLLKRNMRHATEDSRYRKLRLEYGDREKFLMWRFFMYQAISNVLLALPFALIVLSPAGITPFLLMAGTVWLVGFVGESIADHQLKQFVKKPANKGLVCQVGLWNYSRHPNYFFEWLIWLGYGLMAIEAPFGWVGLLSPVLMYYILNYVTGIPMLEELAIKNKGAAYASYQQTTNSFFPWFKKSQTEQHK